MSHVEQDDHSNNLNAESSDFSQIVEKGLSRRRFLQASAATSTIAFFTASPLANAMARPPKTQSLLGFDPIAASTADTVIVPRGYQAQSFIAWGDAIHPSAAAFSQTNSSADQENQFGDNNDGMTFLLLDRNRAVLAVNNESTSYSTLFEDSGNTLTAEKVRRSQAAVGVSIVELQRAHRGDWQVNVNGRLNRRITAYTEMELTGPAAGDDKLKTHADPSGTQVLGTFNNCANGSTPWGTYLTCEENFNGFFGSQNKIDVPDEDARYGINSGDGWFNWHQFDDRFDIEKEPNENHRHGWVVEIDPMNPQSKPKKRTALGRFKHENAALTINKNGRVVVYLGDDERGEHLYKFVSKGKYNEHKPEKNRDLLDEGTLYVAKFDAKDGEMHGDGEWIELTFGQNGLTPENGFNNQADVLIFARQAATQVGATTMDRPEWVAINPKSDQVFCTLTNNKYRGVREGQEINAANPRENNIYGHIIRWEPKNGNHASSKFFWDIYVMAGNPELYSNDDPRSGSTNITADNMFNSPDGIGFDNAGRLWIQTDGNYSNSGDFAGMGNNQMLCGDPNTGEIKRFLSGPTGCEITGLTFSPDNRTLFVGIQHPTGDFSAIDGIPRSTVIKITREDGGVIGA
ncbi:PhoX family protein [Vibrio rumoiensis]|uniref:Transcriptional initiation protein Tat n=1 Tax=Vibrio rumoiensis 1S-45 TaxID=1188252 RepID=A0A1E5E6D5_9VIBR|nr:PhoX family phosphatase [Vibrio rumoiensis]OEF30013.1 transcriptional initiation protein Tat [Vibrio rumoiensis 1S-45]